MVVDVSVVRVVDFVVVVGGSLVVVTSVVTVVIVVDIDGVTVGIEQVSFLNITVLFVQMA